MYAMLNWTPSLGCSMSLACSNNEVLPQHNELWSRPSSVVQYTNVGSLRYNEN